MLWWDATAYDVPASFILPCTWFHAEGHDGVPSGAASAVDVSQASHLGSDRLVYFWVKQFSSCNGSAIPGGFLNWRIETTLEFGIKWKLDLVHWFFLITWRILWCYTGSDAENWWHWCCRCIVNAFFNASLITDCYVLLIFR